MRTVNDEKSPPPPGFWKLHSFDVVPCPCLTSLMSLTAPVAPATLDEWCEKVMVGMMRAATDGAYRRRLAERQS